MRLDTEWTEEPSHLTQSFDVFPLQLALMGASGAFCFDDNNVQCSPRIYLSFNVTNGEVFKVENYEETLLENCSEQATD